MKIQTSMVNDRKYGIRDHFVRTHHAMNRERYHIRCEHGHGEMMVYLMMEGIEVAFSDLHTCRFPEIPEANQVKNLEINYCHKGSFECVTTQNHIACLKEGDICISSWRQSQSSRGFPTGFYQGVSIMIDVEQAGQSLKELLDGTKLDLNALETRLSHYECFVVSNSRQLLRQLFEGMYEIEETIRPLYLKLAVSQILLLLSLQSLDDMHLIPYVTSYQAEQCKIIRDQLMKNLEEDVTIQELSKRYHLSQTTLKSCFKAIYGTSIYAWRKEYRLKHASELLKQSDLRINEIAAIVGYDNPSKFSQAFKKQYQQSPLAYRRICRQNGL